MRVALIFRSKTQMPHAENSIPRDLAALLFVTFSRCWLYATASTPAALIKPIVRHVGHRFPEGPFCGFSRTGLCRTRGDEGLVLRSRRGEEALLGGAGLGHGDRAVGGGGEGRVALQGRHHLVGEETHVDLALL